LGDPFRMRGGAGGRVVVRVREASGTCGGLNAVEVSTDNPNLELAPPEVSRNAYVPAVFVCVRGRCRQQAQQGGVWSKQLLFEIGRHHPSLTAAGDGDGPVPYIMCYVNTFRVVDVELEQVLQERTLWRGKRSERVVFHVKPDCNPSSVDSATLEQHAAGKSLSHRSADVAGDPVEAAVADQDADLENDDLLQDDEGSDSSSEFEALLKSDDDQQKMITVSMQGVTLRQSQEALKRYDEVYRDKSMRLHVGALRSRLDEGGQEGEDGGEGGSDGKQTWAFALSKVNGLKADDDAEKGADADVCNLKKIATQMDAALESLANRSIGTAPLRDAYALELLCMYMHLKLHYYKPSSGGGSAAGAHVHAVLVWSSRSRSGQQALALWDAAAADPVPGVRYTRVERRQAQRGAGARALRALDPRLARRVGAALASRARSGRRPGPNFVAVAAPGRRTVVMDLAEWSGPGGGFRSLLAGLADGARRIF
jgi:hypothetical protein